MCAASLDHNLFSVLQNHAISEVVETSSRLTIPVAVIIERRANPDSRWGYPDWLLADVITGEQLKAGNPSETCILMQQQGTTRFFHGGLKISFFKDGSEGYWYNLLSREPYLFVVCDGEQTAAEIDPFFVTANQDEATGHLESDDIVLSAPMPVSVRDFLERYVVTHYQPEVKKKRKRKDWVEDSLYVSGAGKSGPDKLQ